MAAHASALSLDHLVWRGDQLATPALPGRSTGHAALDAALPGGGWPLAALSELLLPRNGVGELGLLLPLLAAVPAGRWGACIAPPGLPYAPALAAAGVPLERLLIVQAESAAHARWAARQALDSRSCEVVLLWLTDADMGALRRLQLAAEESGTPLILLRPESAARQPSPAVLRLALTPCRGGVGIRILKRRGPQLATPLTLELPWPGGEPRPDINLDSASTTTSDLQPPSSFGKHALVRPLSARSAPPGLRAGAQ